MPRQAHGRSVYTAGPSNTRKQKPGRGKGLNVLEAAEKQFPEKIRIRQHRLGEAEEDSDGPRTRADADERSAKRRKIDISAGADDSVYEGSDLEGNRWHVGVEEEDEDSDIDSDEAFGESDEERFAGFTFRGSGRNEGPTNKPTTKPTPRQQLDLDEEDAEGLSDRERTEESNDEDEDDLGEEAVDLATALDMNDEEERADRTLAKKRIGRVQRNNDSSDESISSAGDEESEVSDQDDRYSDISLSEDDADAETNARLQNFVNGLTPVENKDSTTSKSQALRTLPEKPSQFGLPSVNLSAADLLQYVKDPAQRQSLKILQAGEREEPSHKKGGIPGKLAAPLAKRQQDRLDRTAAYDKSKETLERWVNTVKENRRAEHISFPIADPAKQSAVNIKALQSLDKTRPQSELEAKVVEIMHESGYQVGDNDGEEQQQTKHEELQEKKLPLEEVQARRRELRMQRELMFREEVRARRIKKIKSKAYRRVHRKERDKFAVQERERLLAAGVLNSDEEREQNDRRRAEERMGARHRESKWAKAAKASGQTTWNDDAKAGMSEMARRDDELRRRIEGKSIKDSDASGSESDSDSSYASDDDNDLWKQKLDSLEAQPQSIGQSKLANMAFIQKAEAVRKAENEAEIQRLRKITNGDGDELLGSSEEEEELGRQKYGKTLSKPRKVIPHPAPLQEFEERLSEDEMAISEERSGFELARPETARNRNTPNGKATIDRTNDGSGTASAKQTASSSTSVVVKSLRSPGKPRRPELLDYTSPSESEHEEPGGMDAKDRLALEIFAGDDEADLSKEFEREKKATVIEQGDQVVDNTLPGWGSWAGAGITKREQKKAKGRFLSTIKGVAPEARKDAKLERVIISEKRVKKNTKYLATELPHPFESKQQYERSLRLPMGPEWSTRNHFQDSIKPRVLLKQGQVIQPLARPMAS